MTGSDFFTSADPLLSANNSLFAITTVLNNGPPSPPWDEGDLDTAGGGLDGKDNVELDSLDFLSLSPESLRLDSETEEVITNFLTSVDDLDDLSTSSSEGIVASASLNFSDLVYGSLSNNSASSATSAVVTASNIEPLEAVYLSDSSRSSSSSNDKNNNADVLLSVNKQLTTSTNINNTTSSSSSSFSESIGYCSVCTLVFASASLLEDHKQEFEDRVICCHCKKSFNTMSKLRTHHRKHSKEKPFKCQICDKYYTHRNTLARHQLFSCRPLKIKTEEPNPSETAADDPLTRMILEAEVVLDQKTTATPTNNGKRKSPNLQQNSSAIPTKVSKITSDTLCLVCDKEFHDASSLENHRNYHLNHRECCRCHKVLGNKSKLLTHHRSHTKELPYHCSLCAKSFAELSTLRKHEATHGERNFRCDICSKAFVRKDYLAKHSLTHRQTFKCSQCSYVCHIKVDIERHVTSMHSS